MIVANKKIGETPLQLIKRLREEKKELKKEKLSYAGRLDPMAEGEMVVLVGEENNEREKFLNADKEYIATFLVGISTDSGDILGLIESLEHRVESVENIKDKLNNIKELKEQTYPWFSGKTVKGKKLFEYFKEGNLDIERPKLSVEIKEVEFIKSELILKQDLENYIFDSINKVKGDFRQEEILNKWRDFFEIAPQNLQIFEVKFLVSSGTFIRALTEEFDFPNCLLKLKRTKVLI